jgi:hypothetical protein
VEDKARVRTLNDVTEIYCLNVRGENMAVSKDLLCKEEGSMLEAKFSGRFPIEINNGKVMIDRDPRIFRQMINYVRNNNSIPKFKNKDDAELFRLELEYWSLKPAYSLV